MIDKNLLENIKQLTAERMHNPVSLVLNIGEHDKREELKTFLQQVAQTSDLITFTEEETDLDSPISFKLTNETGDDTGIIFSGIPGGHEFSSLILAILQAGGSDIKLDEGVQKLIQQIDQPLNFTTYVSLSCHNCPDVVQSLNQFALLNKNITHEMIEGGAFAEKIEANNIQGVPAVFLNGESFANGKIDTAKLIEKLQQRYPDLLSRSETDAEQLAQQDVTIIGGGPAGVAAAIYTARKGLKVTIVADRIGGQVKDTQGIENLISIPATTGSELAAKLEQHLREYPITLKEHVSVKSLAEIDNGQYQVTLSTGEAFQSRSVIVATGAQWRKLNVPGEQENIGNGVAYCPHCDGPFFKGKDVAVIGGGNSGVEAALDLIGIVNHVTIFEFAEDFKADQVLLDKAKAHSNINMLASVATTEIKASDGKVTSIVYEDRQSQETKEMPLSAVFVQIGLVPNSQIVKGLVDCTQAGEIIIDERCQTSKQGIFACGDVTTVPYKQINIAMGEGSKAALSAFEYLMMQA